MRNGVVIFLMIGCCGEATADIYKKVVGSNGVITYTNKSVVATEKPVIKTAAPRPATPTVGYFYKYQDTEKHVIYTDKPRTDVALLSKMKVTVPAKNAPPLFFNTPYPPTVTSFYSNPNKAKFNNLIAQAAERHQVDAKLVHAVIQAESAYRPDAVSSAGAVGLMQLMPATAIRFGVIDSNNPEQNINGGTRYLRHLMDLFPNSLDLAVAAYNAGENSVLRHNNSIPPYPETQNYVKQVMALYNQKS